MVYVAGAGKTFAMFGLTAVPLMVSEKSAVVFVPPLLLTTMLVTLMVPVVGWGMMTSAMSLYVMTQNLLSPGTRETCPLLSQSPLKACVYFGSVDPDTMYEAGAGKIVVVPFVTAVPLTSVEKSAEVFVPL